MKLAEAPCSRIAIENPVGIMSSEWRKPDQVIQPYQFGDSYKKKTCLWLKGLPLLTPTQFVDPGEQVTLSSGKTIPKWYSNASFKDRAKVRSKTFPGVAQAMAQQWGSLA